MSTDETYARKTVDWHQAESLALWEAAWAAARKEYPAAAETLVRRVAYSLVKSTLQLAKAGAQYPYPSETQSLGENLRRLARGVEDGAKAKKLRAAAGILLND